MPTIHTISVSDNANKNLTKAERRLIASILLQEVLVAKSYLKVKVSTQATPFCLGSRRILPRPKSLLELCEHRAAFALRANRVCDILAAQQFLCSSTCKALASLLGLEDAFFINLAALTANKHEEWLALIEQVRKEEQATTRLAEEGVA